MKRTRELGALRLEFISFVTAVAMHDDAERGRRRLSGLARDDAAHVVRRRLAAVKDRLGGFVRRRHDLRAHMSVERTVKVYN
jgi:hypothetical protein